MTEQLTQKLQSGSAIIGVIGLGYVGLPICRAFTRQGFNVIGFDIDEDKIRKLSAAQSYIQHIPDSELEQMLDSGFVPTADFDRLTEPEAVLICVPTPLDEHREPDTSYIEQTAESISMRLQPAQLIVLESTTYPGTSREVMTPILESSGLAAGEDFFVGYSPEREDPGNPDHTMEKLPKVVGGLTDTCLELTRTLYDQVVAETVPVSSLETAEATKLLENIYRSTNIALVNELKTLFTAMDIDVFEVIRAASTKPFGFQAFYPGPGLGGHCIPIDPFYLSWRAREFDQPARFIHLAGEINTSMPEYVISRVTEALNSRKKAVNGSRILLIGVAYKPDVDDIRESPAFRLMQLLEKRGAEVNYHDPHVPRLTPTRDYDFRKKSIGLNADTVHDHDLTLVCTDHTDVDYELIRDSSDLVVDTRNVYADAGVRNGKIFKA
ncbi:MAG: nucleotide sugar dehydrogenase [Candidatus Brocadiia bacterium]